MTRCSPVRAVFNQSLKIIMPCYSLRLMSCLFLGLNLMACSSDPRNQLPTVPPVTSNVEMLEGYHDITNCNGIMGWAWNREKPDESVQVEIYDGTTLLTTITASDFRQDLLAAQKGNGRHGFTFAVPPALKDGRPHQIRMKFAGSSRELSNTPREITCLLVTPETKKP